MNRVSPDRWTGNPWVALAGPPAAHTYLLLGQRVVAILETGQRGATYKLATLIAPIGHCIEDLPER
jgi:hypothetical protein